jgi:hypothetical protein
MSVVSGDYPLTYRPLNDVFARECCECHASLEGTPAKVIYDFPSDQRTIQFCPRCARIVATRILLDCMRFEHGDKAVAKFWAARREAVIEKAYALNEFADWPEDLKIHKVV